MDDLRMTIAATIAGSLSKMPAPADAAAYEAFASRRVEDLGLDSLDSMELVMNIEDRFGIMLDEDKVIGCETVGDLVQLAAEAVAGGK